MQGWDCYIWISPHAVKAGPTWDLSLLVCYISVSVPSHAFLLQKHTNPRKGLPKLEEYDHTNTSNKIRVTTEPQSAYSCHCIRSDFWLCYVLVFVKVANVYCVLVLQCLVYVASGWMPVPVNIGSNLAWIGLLLTFIWMLIMHICQKSELDWFSWSLVYSRYMSLMGVYDFEECLWKSSDIKIGFVDNAIQVKFVDLTHYSLPC